MQCNDGTLARHIPHMSVCRLELVAVAVVVDVVIAEVPCSTGTNEE